LGKFDSGWKKEVMQAACTSCWNGTLWAFRESAGYAKSYKLKM